MKDTLSAQQIKAIKALIKYPTTKGSCWSIRNSYSYAERWLSQPEFLDVLHHVQNDYFASTGKGIISSMPEALGAIKDVMRNPTQAGANMKLKAASIFLEQGAKYHKSIGARREDQATRGKSRISRTQPELQNSKTIICKKIVDDYMNSDEYDQ